jgi:hypothetical protein
MAATKRGESSLTNLDAVLNEVSDLHDGSAYHLKPSLYAELDVDSWPFYSEPERGLVKRKLQAVYRQPVTSSNADSLISRGEYTTTTTTPSNMPTTVNTATSNSSGNSSSSTKEKKSRRVEKPVIIVHENPRKTKKSSEESLKNRERSDQALYVPKGRSRNETERGRNDERKKSGGAYKGDGYYGGGGSPSPRSSRPPRSPSGYRNSRHDNQYQFHEDDGDDYQGPDYAGGGTSGDRGRRDDRHDNRHYGNKRNYYNDRRSYK